MGVITSAFFGMSSTSNVSKLADEPELTIVPNCFPNNSEILFSNFFTFSPMIVL